MKHCRKQIGFTLIELLVVISIISILASVVLLALNSTRTKAKNARIAVEINQLRNLIEKSWNGSSYADLLPAANSISNYVAPNQFSNTDITTTINDILTQNGGQYGGGNEASTTACSGSTIKTYYASTNNQLGFPLDGITIMVSPACLPVTSYAIYASLAPIQLSYIQPLIDVAYASLTLPDPGKFAGYTCVDSSGNHTSATNGWIPGYTGIYPSTIAARTVTDGKCY
jgi:prepilin-type N-terminal cleavage/methylation domain-containing protein